MLNEKYEELVGFSQKVYKIKSVMLPVFLITIFLFASSVVSLLLSAVFFIGIMEEKGANIVVLTMIAFLFFLPMMMIIGKITLVVGNLIDYVRANFSKSNVDKETGYCYNLEENSLTLFGKFINSAIITRIHFDYVILSFSKEEYPLGKIYISFYKDGSLSTHYTLYFNKKNNKDLSLINDMFNAGVVQNEATAKLEFEELIDYIFQ